jgi:hypothetical protein
MGTTRNEAGAAGGGPLTIDCGCCELRHTTACHDCVVTYVCDRRAGEAVVVDVSEARAIRLLGQGGLVPQLRHRGRTGDGRVAGWA